MENAAFGGLCDPQAVSALHKAGLNAEVTLPLGGKTDPARGGGPLTVRGRVTSLSDGAFIYEGPMFTGTKGNLGPTACFRAGGIDILVVSHNTQMLDRGLFRAGGIQPEEKSLLAVKSQQHFRGAFGPIAREILVCDSGGFSSADLSLRPFRHVRRPVHPLDPVTWEP